MSFTDAVSRVSQIQAQIASIQGAFNPSVAAATSPSAAGTTATATGSTSPTSFADALAQATGSQTSTSLPAGAQSQLTSGQQQFASRLAGQTGLDPGVISAWLLAEESGGAAQSRQSQNNNDWLNIGYTDSGTFGAGASIWSDPTTAADATAGWLKGQDTIPGYGKASSGIQSILSTAGQPPAAQIAALQHSGWASSGYPSLTSLYRQVAG
jgi:hypothetical protein